VRQAHSPTSLLDLVKVLAAGRELALIAGSRILSSHPGARENTFKIIKATVIFFYNFCI
jgi:hypothetical protein